LTVVNDSGKVTILSAQQFAKLPRQTVKAKDHSGMLATYEGVSLAEILREAGVTLGKDLKGPHLADYLLVRAADGYRVVFSLPEIDPAMTDKLALVADRKDGKLLDARNGPYRLVVPHDKGFSRWVRQVVEITVHPAKETGKRAPGE
jgi:DMSO/TMAO reductase YedYZ molybdopterin-dependent catalytic subunit